jgi:hypothetical protein
LFIGSVPIRSIAVSNLTWSTATVLSSDIGDEKTVTGISTGQSQWFKFYATAGQWIYAEAYDMSGSDNYNIYLRDSDRDIVERSTKSGAAMDYLSYTALSAGYYYVQVKAQLDRIS